MNNKTLHGEYLAPQVKVIEVKMRSILCVSPKHGIEDIERATLIGDDAGWD